MKVLVLGGTGMLGHKLVQVLSPAFEVVYTRRPAAPAVPRLASATRAVEAPALEDEAALTALLDAVQPAVVLNAVGVIKQTVSGRAETIALNALLPNRLQALCAPRGIRLIQFSTDCVYSGRADGQRGPAGYREDDPADARDLYGMSKLLGEPSGPGCLVLRTSIIGPELRGRHSLLEWFLAQGQNPVRGFTQALFTGLPTLELARLIARLLRDHAGLEGLWHVAASSISKYDLLRLVGEVYRRPVSITPDPGFYCDRRLDAARFAAATGWRAPDWPAMIAAMYEDAKA